MLNALLLTENMLSGVLQDAKFNARAFQWLFAPIPFAIQNGRHRYIVQTQRKKKKISMFWSQSDLCADAPTLVPHRLPPVCYSQPNNSLRIELQTPTERISDLIVRVAVANTPVYR